MAKRPLPKSKSIDGFLAELQEQNKTVACWARERGLALHDVYMVIRGRTMGRRGAARDVLIAMGITPPPMYGPAKPLQRTSVTPRVARAAA